MKEPSGSRSVNIGDLNQRAASREQEQRARLNALDPLKGIDILDEYRVVRDLVEEGCPIVFVTGNAGTGKSTLIHYLRTVTTRKHVVVAPTGVAALNVNGVTIHSFFRLAPKINEDEDIKLVRDRRLYRKLELLIVDEISMVRCDVMDSMDKFLRKNRDDDSPFGGVQLLLVGDLFQLPPVVPRQEREVLRAKGYASPFFFSSFALQRTSLVPVELTSVYRQTDSHFVDILNSIRIGDDADSATAEVNQRCYQQDDLTCDLTLTCTNSRADAINRQELAQLTSQPYWFEGNIEGRFSLQDDRLPSPLDLRLKQGARVMFTKNDDQRRWVNGTLGEVKELGQSSIRVGLLGDEDSVYDVLPVSWETFKYSYDVARDSIVAEPVGRYTQYPLMLAWAVTIHKSQGKSMDNVLVDLGNGAFASGQVYVALSRCRSIEGIRLVREIKASDVMCDPLVKRFYLALAQMSETQPEHGRTPTITD
ncbi:MAG: AAA family ATPase [Dehalococcoidia bacterium]|nr:AAA family ATPase [Dehalococcoidia bacterium]